MGDHSSTLHARRRLSLALAALVFVAGLSVHPGDARAQTKEEQAATLATKAVEKGRTGRYLEAIGLFQQAYELDPAPMLLYNIGRVRMRIGDLERAVSTLERYLATEKDPDGIARGEKARDEALAKWQGKLRVMGTESGATLELDGEVVGRTPLDQPLAVAPGMHVLRAYKPGRIPFESEVRIVSQQVASITIELPSVASIAAGPAKEVSSRNDLSGGKDLRAAPEDDEDDDKTLMWVLIGSGAAVLVAGGIVTAVILSGDDSSSPSVDGDWQLFPAAANGGN